MKNLGAAYAAKRMAKKNKSAPMSHADDSDMMDQSMDGDMVKQIMAKKKAKKMAQGGQLPESEDYLAENDSYDDPDFKELDMLDPDEAQMMADGGQVDPKPTPSSGAQDMEDSMRKAFGTAPKKPDDKPWQPRADGGMIDGISDGGADTQADQSSQPELKADDDDADKKNKRMASIFSSMLD